SRGDYQRSALVFEPAARQGGKPVLHGVGRIRPWIASNATQLLAITTEAPSKKVLRKLGLQAPDGTSPFELPPPGPAAPPKPATQPRQLPSAPFGEMPAEVRSALTAQIVRHVNEAKDGKRPIT